MTIKPCSRPMRTTGKVFDADSNRLSDALEKFIIWPTKTKLTINLSKLGLHVDPM